MTSIKPPLDSSWTRISKFNPKGPSSILGEPHLNSTTKSRKTGSESRRDPSDGMDHDANSSQDEDRTDQEDQEEDQNDDDDQEDGEHGEEESEWECFEEETLIVTLDLGPDGNNILSNSLDYSITGLDTSQPFLRTGGSLLRGQWDELMGTEILMSQLRDASRPASQQHILSPLELQDSGTCLSYPIEDPNSSPQDVIPFPSGTTQRRIRFTPGTLRREPRRGSTSPSREKPKARPKPKPRKSRGKGKGKAKEEDSDEEEVQDGSDEEDEPTEKKRRGGRRTAMTDRDRIKMAMKKGLMGGGKKSTGGWTEENRGRPRGGARPRGRGRGRGTGRASQGDREGQEQQEEGGDEIEENEGDGSNQQGQEDEEGTEQE